MDQLISTINALAGMAVGFHKKGGKQISDLLLTTAEVCKQKQIKLIVIGTINSHNTSLIGLQYAAVNLMLKKNLEANGITYVNVFEAMEQKVKQGESLYLKDHYHLNVAGHAIVADALYAAAASSIQTWLKTPTETQA
jgi:hypothetical protein